VSDIDARLAQCMLAAFGDLTAPELIQASVETVPDWDSLHAVVLISLLEEAFAIRIPAAAYPGLRSYAAIREYLRHGSATGKSPPGG
jgi:acyl carrier protein